MPRDSSGNFTLPAGNPVASGATVSSSWANNTLDDVKDAVTDSLDRNGRGGMAAALKAYAGTKALPGLTFLSETSSGFYYASAGDVRFSLQGDDLVQFKAGAVNRWDGSAWKALLAAGDTLTTDTISESTSAAGVTIDGVLLKDNGIEASGTVDFTGTLTVDTINESTSDAGVTVEGVQLIDSGIVATGDVDFSGAAALYLTTIDSIDINGGAIDGTPIGAANASTGAFTTLSATGGITGDLTGDVTGNVTGDVTGNVTGDVIGDVAGSLTGDVTGDVTGNLTGDVTGNITKGVVTITGSTPAINPADGGFQFWTLPANSTPTFADFGEGDEILIAIADGPAYTITWPGTMFWVGGSGPPTLNGSYQNLIRIWYANSTLYGHSLGIAHA